MGAPREWDFRLSRRAVGLFRARQRGGTLGLMTQVQREVGGIPLTGVAAMLQAAPEMIGAPPGVSVAGRGLPDSLTVPSQQSVAASGASRWATVGLAGLRLVLGFEFLWAFLDKTFGLGYATPHARAWIRGGSPTSGFLKGAEAGPFQGVFRSLSGVPGIDWLFMAGLLGIGVAFLLGVALRPAAFFGVVMLTLMWAAVWVPAKIAGGQPSGSTNPLVDDHIVSIFGFIVVAAFAQWGTGYLGRRWNALPAVHDRSWIR